MKKGQTNNPNGRPKGKPNRVTGEMRIWVQGLIDQNRETLEADLLALEPQQRWMVVEKLMNYCIPKQSSIEADLSIPDLTNEQLDFIINRISEGLNDGN